MTKARILFLCRHNSCRSQIGEAWVRHLLADRFDACSAGVDGERSVNPRAVQIMNEFGIDISRATSKFVTDFEKDCIDMVVTVCDTDNCPSFTSNKTVIRLHQAFDDPPALTSDMTDEAKILDVYRRVAIEIRDYVLMLPGIYSEKRPSA
jgi:arsenate reductase